MLRQLLRLASSWIGADRIRISPCEGRLLSLRVGDRVYLRDRIWRVIRCVAPERALEGDDSAPSPLVISNTLDDDGNPSRHFWDTTRHHWNNGATADTSVTADNGAMALVVVYTLSEDGTNGSTQVTLKVVFSAKGESAIGGTLFENGKQVDVFPDDIVLLRG
ncbi:MAG: hypothetical protein ABL921_16510 [Pirellula sp.]